MSYLVMECHPGYAVVMDSAGRFLKAANLHYQVGARVTDVVLMHEEEKPASAAVLPLWRKFAAVAACFCLLLFGAETYLMIPFGSVRMQINPDVRMTVNSLDYVIALEGLNSDGWNLILGYHYTWKKVDTVTDELTDRAEEMGYLKTGGSIRLTVESQHESWKTATREQLVKELSAHTGDTFKVEAAESSSGNTAVQSEEHDSDDAEDEDDPSSDDAEKDDSEEDDKSEKDDSEEDEEKNDQTEHHTEEPDQEEKPEEKEETETEETKQTKDAETDTKDTETETKDAETEEHDDEKKEDDSAEHDEEEKEEEDK